jgi:hypothetical protein
VKIERRFNVGVATDDEVADVDQNVALGVVRKLLVLVSIDGSDKQGSFGA